MLRYIKYNILPTLCLAISLASLWFPTYGLIIGIPAIISTSTLIYHAAHHLSHLRVIKDIWLSFYALMMVLVIGSTALYMVYAITPLTLSGFLFAVWILSLQGKPIWKKEWLPKRRTSFEKIDLFIFPIVGLQIALFLKLIEKSTTIALASPWLLTGRFFFLAYGFSLLLLILFSYKTKKQTVAMWLITVQSIITFNVISIIYLIGYGYDPFLHRAAQSHIFENGFIDPKTPFYIGQYVSVVGLTHLTHFPLKLIDIYLVPLIAGLSLPYATYIGLARGLKTKRHWARIGAIAAILFPLQTFYVTTPHNLATLLTFLLILLSPAALRYKDVLLFSGLLALTAVAVHPLSGIFALWLWIGLFAIKKHVLPHLAGLYLIFGSLLTPALFVLHLIRQGHGIPPLDGIYTNLATFLTLFKDPYYITDLPAPWYLDLVYLYQSILPFLIVGLALFGARHVKRRYVTVLLAFPLMLLINMLLLSTWIAIPELDAREHLQYSERIRHLVLLFLMPLTLFGLTTLGSQLRKEQKRLAVPLLALVLTGSWYLTYPQYNARVHFPGYNVTGADQEAATYIEMETSSTTSYVVLGSILTAAASVEQYGFPHYVETNLGELFYYSVPSGSPLYQAYLDLLYDGQRTSTIDEVFTLTSVDRIYVTLNAYWSKSKTIAEGLRAIADDEIIIGDQELYIFIFDRDTAPEAS